MFCEHCGMKLQDDWVVCPGCGAEVERNEAEDTETGYIETKKAEASGGINGAGVVEVETKKRETRQERGDEKSLAVETATVKNQSWESRGTQATWQDAQINRPHSGGYSDRIEYHSFLKYILLSIVTCGIYGIYALYKYTKGINKVCAGDGKESPNYIVVWLLSMVTFGIYGLYWWYTQGNRLYNVAPKYGVSVREKGSTILLWNVLGCSVMPILGMFVATYIMFDNMNAIARVYNGDVSGNIGGRAKRLHPNLVRNVLVGYGIIVILAVLMLASLIKSILSPEFSGGSNIETQRVSDMDLESLMGQSEAILENMGFVYDEEYMDYRIPNNDGWVACLASKIYMIYIDGDALSAPSFHGVRIGMTMREAESLLSDDYECRLEDEKYDEYYNRDSEISILVFHTSGIVTEISAEQMSENVWGTDGQEGFGNNTVAEVSEYIIEDSTSRYLTDEDVWGLSLQEINYAKNEIYARHGRMFNSRELQTYFNSKSWYVGQYSPEDFDQNYSSSVLNDYEKKNADFLREKEFAIAPNGYQLDAN